MFRLWKDLHMGCLSSHTRVRIAAIIHFPTCMKVRPHTAVTMCDGTFSGRWIGRVGPVYWAHASLISRLWIVFTDYLRMTLQTRGSIIEAVGSVQKRILTHTWAELFFQLYVFRATRGSHVDVG